MEQGGIEWRTPASIKDGSYQVSRTGMVRNRKTGRHLKIRRLANGGKRVTVDSYLLGRGHQSPVMTQLDIDALVAEAFPKPAAPQETTP